MEAWILEADAVRRRMVVSGSEFGFKPISDRMRPRYVEALRHVGTALQSGSLREQDSEYVSEVKGMFNRCVRRDQWDWHAVYLALGSPSRELAEYYATELGDLSKRLRMSRIVGAEAMLSRFDDGNLLQILTGGLRAISVTSPPLPSPRSTDRVSQAEAAPHRRARSPMSDEQRGKVASATVIHGETLRTLSTYLADAGHVVESNQFVDLFCRLKSGPALFEVKSITAANALHQVRAALAQLYEYRFRHQVGGASLWVVLSQEPTVDAWLVDYLETDRDVRVLWVVGGRLAGPSIDRLLESGSAELRRRQSSRD